MSTIRLIKFPSRRSIDWRGISIFLLFLYGGGWTEQWIEWKHLSPLNSICISWLQMSTSSLQKASPHCDFMWNESEHGLSSRMHLGLSCSCENLYEETRKCSWSGWVFCSFSFFYFFFTLKIVLTWSKNIMMGSSTYFLFNDFLLNKYPWNESLSL